MLSQAALLQNPLNDPDHASRPIVSASPRVGSTFSDVHSVKLVKPDIAALSVASNRSAFALAFVMVTVPKVKLKSSRSDTSRAPFGEIAAGSIVSEPWTDPLLTAPIVLQRRRGASDPG